MATVASSPVSTLLKTQSRLLQLLSPYSIAWGEGSVTNTSLPNTTQSALNSPNQHMPIGISGAHRLAMAKQVFPSEGVGRALNIHINTPDYQQGFRPAITDKNYIRKCTYLLPNSMPS